jgi:hypothetical protein
MFKDLRECVTAFCIITMAFVSESIACACVNPTMCERDGGKLNVLSKQREREGDLHMHLHEFGGHLGHLILADIVGFKRPLVLLARCLQLHALDPVLSCGLHVVYKMMSIQVHRNLSVRNCLSANLSRDEGGGRTWSSCLMMVWACSIATFSSESFMLFASSSKMRALAFCSCTIT